MQKRKAFTLIEVLISIALLGLILVPLFSVVNMMRQSNDKLLDSLEKSEQITQATKVLFLDILGSDGKLDIQKDEFTRLCIEKTSNSLYNLPEAKVCWIVLKKDNTLARIEGNGYKLPTKSEDRVEVDRVMRDVELFDVYHEKDKVLVLLKQKAKKPISFMVQGITNPVLKVLPDGTQVMRDERKILPDGTQVFPDGSKILPDGTHIDAPPKKAPAQRSNRRPGRRGTPPGQQSPQTPNSPAPAPPGQPTQPVKAPPAQAIP